MRPLLGWFVGLVIAVIVAVAITWVTNCSESIAFVIGLACGLIFPMAGFYIAIELDGGW